MLRRPTPEELEALHGFSLGFTAMAGVTDTARAMLMGNALVVGLVRRIGESLYRAHVCQNYRRRSVSGAQPVVRLAAQLAVVRRHLLSSGQCHRAAAKFLARCLSLP